MEIKFTTDFDHKMIEDQIKHSDDPEKMRETINFMTQCINQPTKDVVKICFMFKQSVEKSIKEVVGDNKDDVNALSQGIGQTFAASVIGNLIEMFNISEKETLSLVKQVMQQSKNIKKQDEDNQK